MTEKESCISSTDSGEEKFSPEMQQVLEEEAIEADIEAAIDAAFEEGILITREEAIKIIQDSKDKSNLPPQDR